MAGDADTKVLGHLMASPVVSETESPDLKIFTMTCVCCDESWVRHVKTKDGEEGVKRAKQEIMETASVHECLPRGRAHEIASTR